MARNQMQDKFLVILKDKDSEWQKVLFKGTNDECEAFKARELEYATDCGFDILIEAEDI